MKRHGRSLQFIYISDNISYPDAEYLYLYRGDLDILLIIVMGILAIPVQVKIWHSLTGHLILFVDDIYQILLIK